MVTLVREAGSYVADSRDCVWDSEEYSLRVSAESVPTGSGSGPGSRIYGIWPEVSDGSCAQGRVHFFAFPTFTFY